MKTKYRFISNDYDLRKLEMFARENDENSSRRLSRIKGLQCLSDDLLKEVYQAFEDGEHLICYRSLLPL